MRPSSQPKRSSSQPRPKAKSKAVGKKQALSQPCKASSGSEKPSRRSASQVGHAFEKKTVHIMLTCRHDPAGFGTWKGFVALNRTWTRLYVRTWNTTARWIRLQGEFHCFEKISVYFEKISVPPMQDTLDADRNTILRKMCYMPFFYAVRAIYPSNI